MTNKTLNLKKLNRIIVWTVAILLTLASFSFLHFVVPNSAFANTAGSTSNGSEVRAFIDFAPRNLGVDNPRFAASAGRTPASPTGWTETTFPNMARGATVMGVFDRDEYNANVEVRRETRLYEYAHYARSTPRPLPHTRVNMPDGHNRFLMINTTEDTTTAVGYNSSNITLSRNGFFRVSAWTKTNFVSTNGASIRINGIADHDIAFTNIHTVAVSDRADHSYLGWERFEFFIRTSPIADETIQLTLAVGDYYRGLTQPGGEYRVPVSQMARGYAFFDNIEAYEISPTVFYGVLANNNVNFTDSPIQVSGRTQFVDLSLPVLNPAFYTGDSITPYVPLFNFNSDNLVDGLPTGWNLQTGRGAGISHGDLVRPLMQEITGTFNPDTCPYNLEENPLSPQGRNTIMRDTNGAYVATGGTPTNENILTLSTFDNRFNRGQNARYRNTAVGVVSSPFTIRQMEFYRLSVWVNTHHITGGAGATLVVETDVEDVNIPIDTTNPNDPRTTPIRFIAQSASGDATNLARHGWRQYAFYVRGSFHQDYNITLGLWLGQEYNLSGGTAMFADPRLERLTGTQFALNSAMSAGGTPVDIDGAADPSAIINGNFLAFETPVDISVDNNLRQFPLTPTGWEFNTPSTINRLMFSNDETLMREHFDATGNNRRVFAGIMPTDTERLLTKLNDENYRGTYHPATTTLNLDTPAVLYMAATHPVAFNFTSSSFSLNEGVHSRVVVRMRVDHIEGYGASLVLRDENGVISNIQNITTTDNQFMDFAFYLENNEEARSLQLEIWLGFIERAVFNANKLSSGIIYVESVDIVDTTQAIFNARMTEHRNNLNAVRSTHRHFAAVSYLGFGFDNFDAYDASFVRFPYLWSISGPPGATTAGIRSGIFDSARRREITDYGTGNSFYGGIPSSFNNADARDANGNLYRNNVLLLEHSQRTSSRLTFDRPLILAEDSYYALEVSIAVDMPNDLGVGVGIHINDEFYFSGISSRVLETGPLAGRRFNDTETIIDAWYSRSAFRTYTFLIYTGDASRHINVAFTLGGEVASEFSEGRLFVNHIALNSITNVDFDERAALIRQYDEFGRTFPTMMAVLGQPPVGDDVDTDVLPDTGPAGIDVFLIPGILFAVLLLFAILILVVSRIAKHRAAKLAKAEVNPKKASKRAKARYDRGVAAQRASDYENFKSGVGTPENISDSEEAKVFEDFDDEIAPKKQVDTKKGKPVKEIKETPVVPVKEEAAPTVDETSLASDDFVDSFDD